MAKISRGRSVATGQEAAGGGASSSRAALSGSNSHAPSKAPGALKRSRSNTKGSSSQAGLFQNAASPKASSGKDTAPGPAASCSDRDLTLSFTKNASIGTNPLWGSMQRAAGFLVAKESVAQTAGMGDRPTGADLRRLTARIHSDLDNEANEEDFKVDEAMKLELPDILWDSQKLRTPIQGKLTFEGIDFWMQQGMQRAIRGETAAAMDYYRQGLRKNPTNLLLIYNLANSYKKLRKYTSTLTWFMHGVQLNPRWVDGLCGLATTYFNMQQYELALHCIKAARFNYWKGLIDGDEQKSRMLGYETVCFIGAMCLKMTNRLDDAGKAYGWLAGHFRQQRLLELANYMFGLVLIPLQEDRKMMADHLTNVAEVVEYMQEVPTQNQDGQILFLSKYCAMTKDRKRHIDTTAAVPYHNPKLPVPTLDWERYGQSITKLLTVKSFFKRFEPEHL